MVQKAPPVKLSHRDLLQWPDDGRRHELIDGEHFVTPSPSTRHQALLTRLLARLFLHLHGSGAGQIFPAPLDVVLSDFDVVQPDLLVVTESTAHRLDEANLHGAPDMVVEILSPSTAARDRGLKRTLYEKFGVREYWIVDPDADRVEVLRLTEGRLDPVATLGAADVLDTPLLPGLEIQLAAVFEG